jgi:hyperosmotically inducible protein
MLARLTRGASKLERRETINKFNLEVQMNSGKKIVLSTCVALALVASSAWGETIGAAVDDAALTAKVKTSLIENPATKARQINVETNNGVVQLNGFVDSAVAKAEAEKAAKAIAGVQRVDNNLQVGTGERTAGMAMNDTAITAKVKAALIADSRTKAHQIEVSTNKGIVSLGGFVTSSAEKQAAEAVTENVTGVVKVQNGIKVGRN